MILYYPCFECQNKYGREYSVECDEQCDYAIAVKEKKKLEKKNGLLYEILLKHRICPQCGEQMSFYIEGNFGGSLGVFECDCGHKDKSIENMSYATSEDWDRFWKETEDIMW